MRFRMLAASVCVATFVAGCHSGAGPAKTAAEARANGPVHVTSISDEEFAAQAEQVLTSPRASADLVASVANKQLERARHRFESAGDDAGLAAFSGAIYLLGQNELRAEVLRERTTVLNHAAAAVARSGSTGKADAIYGWIEKTAADEAARRQARSHLAAIESWKQVTQGGSGLLALGERQRTALDRALFDPRAEALAASDTATIRWMLAALELGSAEAMAPPSREEAIEAYRAVRSGAASIIGSHLRYRDARGALDVIDNQGLRNAVPRGLYPQLKAAADGSVDAWANLFAWFDAAQQSNGRETALDPEVATAAAFGSALALHRAAPQDPAASRPLAALLTRYGMSQVGVRLLARPARNSETLTDEDLGFGLQVIYRAIVEEDIQGQMGEVRRIYAEAGPLLKVARSGKAQRIRPTHSQIDLLVGALETRVGEIDRARPLIQRAVSSQPTLDGLRLLGSIERQQGRNEQAIAAFQRLAELAREQDQGPQEAEGYLLAFEVHRDQGDAKQAEALLQRALQNALDARRVASPGPELARSERLLARTLEHFGDREAVRRAEERAYEASRSDGDELTATVLDTARRALTRADLGAARLAVRRALEEELEGEDLVYVALWLRLLENQLGIKTDGTVEEALERAESSESWPAKLRLWARGKLDDTALLSAAKGVVEQTEAVFYTAMTKQAKNALPELKQVAESKAIQLVEVTIARDLVAAHNGPTRFELPRDISLP